MRIRFGIIAHENRDVLEDQIANLLHCCPNATITVFNGGPDDAWLAQGISVPVSPRSKPMTYPYLAEPAYSFMLDAVDDGIDFDYLVVLDSDMLILKPGFEEQLDGLLRHFAYVATDLAANGHFATATPAREVANEWELWSEVFGATTPYVVFNPGQTFRRDLVFHIAADPAVPVILAAVAENGLQNAEEFVWPTYVVSRGFAATSHSGNHGLGFRYFEPAELVLRWADPSVFLIHKVRTEIDAPDRAAIRRLATVGATEEEVAKAAADCAAVEVPISSGLRRLRFQTRLIRQDVQILFRAWRHSRR